MEVIPVEDSTPSSKPCLFPHKFSICPPCRSVLTGGMHMDPSLIPSIKWMQLASFDCRWLSFVISEHALLLTLKVALLVILKVLLRMNPSPSLFHMVILFQKDCHISARTLLCCYAFSCEKKNNNISATLSFQWIFTVMFWLTELAVWSAAKNPPYEFCSLSYLENVGLTSQSFLLNIWRKSINWK